MPGSHGLQPAWLPIEGSKTHIAQLMRHLNFSKYEDFYAWSVEHYADFWEMMVNQLKIIFDQNYTKIVDLSAGLESPQWFKGAKLNIANSCFHAKKTDVAIRYQSEKGVITEATYQALNDLSNRVAYSLQEYLKVGDKAAIIMPMTPESIAIYLGIIKAGCCVVSIAESFSTEEIATRLKIANAKLVFTQDKIIRHGKTLSLYKKVMDANSPLTILVSAEKSQVTRRNHDLSWEDFLSTKQLSTAVSCDPQAYTTILFSSGTTGDPKAIPWTHTIPIKAASDGYLYQNITSKDVVCWPSSLGWMMGSWLIYASLINRATMAIYEGVPTGRDFGEFVQNAKVTVLGVVPTIVKTWRDSRCMEGLDWSTIKLFTSTGECSNPDDMLYLMSLANGKPVIEYCGGTEIGGAYLTSTLLHPSIPAAFSTKTLGLDFVILDQQGKLAKRGEVALIPPSIGLSTHLLNKNHHEVYYAGMPSLFEEKILRRHGDEIEQFENGFYQLYGRVDDTMNLGGIKVSSIEIERVINTIPDVKETAAIGVNSEGAGPSQLVIYAVLKEGRKKTIESLKVEMQDAIKQFLNPLFKIDELILINSLPKTVSNKIIRGVLRGGYRKSSYRSR